MSVCISKKKGAFERHYGDYNEAETIQDNIEYIFHKKKLEVSCKGVIAILPAFNEELTIGSMVLQAKEHAERVIVVDDGSSDRTAHIASSAGAEVIHHPRNMGKEAALKTGFGLATQNGAKVIVTMDSNGKHDPEEISNLTAPIMAGEADMVFVGNLKNGYYSEFSVHINYPLSTFQAFSRSCFEHLRTDKSILNLITEAGLKVIGIPSQSKRSKNNKIIRYSEDITIAAMPAYNEERSISKMILSCKNFVDIVVVVDDGSNDLTAEIARALGAYVVQHPRNMGYGAAIKTCFETARQLKANKMVIIDSDGQHDPDEIPKLLGPLNNNYADLVIGSRFINGNGKNVPIYRKIGMKVLDMATNIGGDIKVTDTQSGFRAYGKKSIEKININGSGMSAGSEILMQIKEHGLKVKEVEIHCSYDVENPSSDNPVSHGLKVLVNILKEIEYKKPLYYLTIPGIILTISGIVLGISFLERWISGGQLPFGPSLFMILITTIGLFSVFTGIILHSVSGLLDHLNMNERRTI